jgi:hypothetical protein
VDKRNPKKGEAAGVIYCKFVAKSVSDKFTFLFFPLRHCIFYN